jgi:hypothetical protein
MNFSPENKSILLENKNVSLGEKILQKIKFQKENEILNPEDTFDQDTDLFDHLSDGGDTNIYDSLSDVDNGDIDCMVKDSKNKDSRDKDSRDKDSKLNKTPKKYSEFAFQWDSDSENENDKEIERDINKYGNNVLYRNNHENEENNDADHKLAYKQNRLKMKELSKQKEQLNKKNDSKMNNVDEEDREISKKDKLNRKNSKQVDSRVDQRDDKNAITLTNERGILDIRNNDDRHRDDGKVISSKKPKNKSKNQSNTDANDGNDKTSEELKYENTIFRGISSLKDCSPEKLLVLYEKLKIKWFSTTWKDMDSTVLFTLIQSNFCIKKQKDFTLLSIDEGMKLSIGENMTLWEAFRRKKMITDDPCDEYVRNFKNILEIIYYGERILCSFVHAKRSMDPNYDTSMNEDETMHKFQPKDTTEMTGYHKLLYYIMESLSFNKCRRYKGYVCQEVYINGNRSHYWEKKWTVKEFIEMCTNEDFNNKMWKIREDKNNFEKTERYFLERKCKFFPDVDRQRGIYTFANGLYNSRHVDVEANGKLSWKFYRFDDKTTIIPGKLISCKMFDIDFTGDAYTSWSDVPTPELDNIVGYQFKMYDDYKDIYLTLCALLGRLIAPLCIWDKWSVAPFLIGQAGTGKSTIVNDIVHNFFEPVDVGILQNKNEGIFAFQKHYEKMVLMALEVDNTFNTPPTFLKSIIAGEWVSIAKKNRDPEDVRWTSPLIMCGNEMIGLRDNAGGMTRRVVKFQHVRKVKKEDIDTSLEEKLKTNMPNIIHKCTLAYLQFREKVGNDDIWNHLCQYFIDQREKVSRESNPLYEFLNSKRINYGPHLKHDYDDFRLNYLNYCRASRYDPGKFNDDLYIGPFADMSNKLGTGQVIRLAENMKYITADGEEKVGDFIIGLQIADSDTA